MERSQIAGALIIIFLVVMMHSGCANPFAPALRGSTGSLWTEAATVGELLQNFETAYRLGDSLQYAELLDEQFQFQYYDAAMQRTDGWYRETDLQATARMFRSFQNISLIWGRLSPEIESIDTPDSAFEIRVQYQLLLDDFSPLIGFARFTLYKQSGDRFRILLWRDDI